MKVLSISYGRAFFDANHPERKRMEACASGIESLHMIVFTLKKDNLTVSDSGSHLVIHPTNSRSKFHMVFDAISMAKKIVKSSPLDWVVTAQDPFEAGIVGYAVSRAYGLPLNIQEHGDFFSTSYWRQDIFLNNIRFLVGKFLLRKADTVRVVSERIKKTMLALGVPESKIVYLPVRTDVIAQDTTTPVDLHAEYPDASTIVLTMSRLVSQKNIPLLIRAFEKLYRIDTKALLLIVGSGGKRDELSALVEEKNMSKNVVFLPWTSDPYSLISACDIFALSSDWEGWARVLIEAMVAGIPIVTTNVGCAGEVLIDNKHGFVVEPKDETTFAEKLIQLAQNKELQKEFGAQAKIDGTHVHVSEEEYVTLWRQVWEVTSTAASK